MKQVYESSERLIQGLYQPHGACQSYWTLKAKVDLAIFRDHRKEKHTMIEKQTDNLNLKMENLFRPENREVKNHVFKL